MKLKNYFALVLMGVTLLTSCNKDEDLKGDKGVSTGKREVFTASISEVEAFDLLEYGADENEARASITSKGYAVPKLEVSLAELQDGSTQAHWGVLGDSQTPLEESVPNTKIVVAEPESTPTESTLFFKASTEPQKKNELKFYCPVSDDLNSTSSPVSNKWAYFAVGGARNGQYLEFNGATSPNKIIKGIMKDETQSARQIPLISKVMPFDKILGKDKKPVTLSPRGCLVGLCFLNKLDKNITIEEIVVTEKNALYFEGQFDMRKNQEETTHFDTSVSLGTGQKAFFKGDEGAHTYTVTKGELGKATKKWSELTNDEKNDLKIFHLWGMPRKDGGGCYEDRLSVQVKFSDKDGDSFTTRIFRIALPKNAAFKEGKSYRLPIEITKKSVLSTYGQGKNPLMYVAEHVVRKDGKGFVTDYHIPSLNNYNNWDDTTDPGFFSWQSAKALFNGSKVAFNNYILPSRWGWQSIIPHYIQTPYVNFMKEISVRTLVDKSQVGQTSPRNYTAEYITKRECPNYVTYAIRFKNTEWESAWRYSFDKKKKTMIIECIGGFRDSNKTLADISYPEFFSDNSETTKRIIPTYGFLERYNDVSIQKLGKQVHYWSSTPWTAYDGHAMYFFRGYAAVGNFRRYQGYPVLPFKKNIN